MNTRDDIHRLLDSMAQQGQTKDLREIAHTLYALDRGVGATYPIVYGFGSVEFARQAYARLRRDVPGIDPHLVLQMVASLYGVGGTFVANHIAETEKQQIGGAHELLLYPEDGGDTK